MHNTEVKGLWLGFNGHSGIIKEISVTLFRNLVELHLCTLTSTQITITFVAYNL